MLKEAGHLRLAGVIGWPVSHSLSPLIHTTWAAREGVTARYEAIPIEADSDRAFRREIEALRARGFVGVNVTLPHKERALAVADRASEAATRAGAANMLTLGEDVIVADNSGIEGFFAPLEKALAGDRPGVSIVLGAGGASRAIIIALKRAGARNIVVLNRTEARARELAERFDVGTAPWEERAERLDSADVLVNTTSLGMTGAGALDLSLAAASDKLLVADIVYTPLKTPLLAAAEKRGMRTIDGLDMLMHQAAPGYRAWLGRRADVDDELRARLVAALEARS